MKNLLRGCLSLVFNRVTAVIIWLSLSGSCMELLLRTDYDSPYNSIPIWMVAGQFFFPEGVLLCFFGGAVVGEGNFRPNTRVHLHMLHMTVLATIAAHFGYVHGVESFCWWYGYQNWEWSLAIILGTIIVSHWWMLLAGGNEANAQTVGNGSGI